MPRLRYVLWTRAAVLPYLLGIALMWLAFRFALRAHRADPTAVPPNCGIYAAIKLDQRHREWLAANKPPGREPYLLLRMGRLEPEIVPHALVGDRDPDSGFMGLTSFKPVDPKPARFWQLWRRTEFAGEPKDGD
jgi:hypothetical protein